MQVLGQRAGRLLAAWTALGGLVALGPALWMWGFTVDDALISVRYARHVGDGIGWRFDAAGPSTDGVTPLPWPLLLVPLARGASALVVLERAKALGLLAWSAAGALLGRAVGKTAAPAWARVAALATLALSVPVAAHAVSGMETALATSLATCAAVAVGRPRQAAVLAGLAASLRPEMAPWACVLATGAAFAETRDPNRCLGAAAIALGPFVACALIRTLVWGRPAPLALLAKPSDLDHGLRYAGAACVVTLTPLLVLAPAAVARTPRALVLVLAAFAQVAALVLVGGDWMPYARLMVPVAPSLAYAAVLTGAQAHRAAMAARSVVALALGLTLVARGGTSGRTNGADRASLIARARPWLAPSGRVAALDVGWVSAATEADIVDLAGVTDPEIAVLPGTHTAKHVDARFLMAREPDALLIYAPRGLAPGGLAAWRDAQPAYAVEAHLMAEDVIARRFTPAAWLPLGVAGGGYVLLRAAPEAK
jgi:hypothetical protein